MKSKEKRLTDLGKAQQFAIPINSFTKLVEGDISSAVSLLLYVMKSDAVKAKLIEVMYEEYLEDMAKKSNQEGGSDVQS